MSSRFHPTATGLGTSATRIGNRPSRDTGPGTRPGVPIPGLYCPEPVRVDEALGVEVNERLVAWVSQLGIFTEQLDQLRDTNFGRLAMLVHPDTDEPEQLMLAARCLVAEWAVDDLYCDDESAGAVPARAGARLALAMAAAAPPALFGTYADDLRTGLRADPVLVALRSSIDRLTHAALPTQVARLRQELAELLLGMAGESSWRVAGEVPPVWEYLAARQLNSFTPCLALIDVVGRYVLAADLYYDPRVRRATRLAGAAATLANDLYSMARDAGPRPGEFNLPSLIAAEENRSLGDAMAKSVEYHNEVVRAFEAARANLSVIPVPELQRFLWGLHGWLGGNNEWHRNSVRYSG